MTVLVCGAFPLDPVHLAAEIPSKAPNNNVPTISFRHDVLPLLTRAGCNAGTCHGTPSGKNGFRLSLRGYDPELDFTSLTREVRARRVDRLQPDRSLVLLKATASVPHEGGRRFKTDSAEYRLLWTWIAQGAHDDATSPKLESLTLTPSREIVDPPIETLALRAKAQFADEGQRDVTHLCRFSVNDESVGTVDSTGVLHMLQRGEVTVSAEYSGAFATSRVIFRGPAAEFVWSNPPAGTPVDQLVFDRLKLLQINPSELTTDEAFVRRVYLDVIGRLPEPEEILAFLADTSSHKRSRLIDELLERPEFAEWWALKWSDRLGCNQRFVGQYGAMKYHDWIRHAMAVNMPEDEFARRLLTATGPNYSVPEASFWRRLRVGGIGENVDPLLAAEEISQLFLGVRIQCARCHNHPGERWTQDDYYGMAAFFPRVKFQSGPYFNHTYDQENTVYLVEQGEVNHSRTGQIVAPALLGMGEAASMEGVADRREVFATWLTAPENPFFAKAAVNRLWFHLFGRGLVEPVDDFRSSNPPSHPEVLEYLSDELVASGFDRKYIIRLILNSRTYQWSSQATADNVADEKYFSHARIRLLQAEQLLDAISQATAVPETFPNLPEGTRAVALPDGEFKHPFLEAFGRPARAIACECERESGTNLNQALQLVSGAVVQAKLADERGRVARLAASTQSADAVVEELFLATLSRRPTAAELKLVVDQITATEDRRQACEDVLWSLLNHREFLFQH